MKARKPHPQASCLRHRTQWHHGVCLECASERYTARGRWTDLGDNTVRCPTCGRLVTVWPCVACTANAAVESGEPRPFENLDPTIRPQADEARARLEDAPHPGEIRLMASAERTSVLAAIGRYIEVAGFAPAGVAGDLVRYEVSVVTSLPVTRDEVQAALRAWFGDRASIERNMASVGGR